MRAKSKSQSSAFAEAARAAECDEDEKRLRAVGGAKPAAAPKTARKAHTQDAVRPRCRTARCLWAVVTAAFAAGTAAAQPESEPIKHIVDGRRMWFCAQDQDKRHAQCPTAILARCRAATGFADATWVQGGPRDRVHGAGIWMECSKPAK
jgi:hypothetical protein